MTDTTSTEADQKDSSQLTLLLSELEADVAYFDARLTLLGNDPETPYQKAQFKAYKIMERYLKKRLLEQKRALTLLRE